MAITILHTRAEYCPDDVTAACAALVTDPPYSDHVHDNVRSVHAPGLGGRGVEARDLGFDSLSDTLRRRIAHMATRVQRWSLIFSDIEGAAAWREAVAAVPDGAAEYVRAMPWVRWSQPQLSGDRPPQGCELISVFHRAVRGPRGGVRVVGKRWSGPGSLTHFAERCLRGAEKHPTEKPLDLMLTLVAYFSEAGETVLDPCAGAGTTGQACRILGRDALLLEADAGWARRADHRCSAPLTAAERDRVGRWCEAQLAIVEEPLYPGAEDSARKRRARLAADVGRAMEWL